MLRIGSYLYDRCEIPIEKLNIFKEGSAQTIGRRSHMNTYEGGETSQGKIIPIKRHCSSLIFGIFT